MKQIHPFPSFLVFALVACAPEPSEPVGEGSEEDAGSAEGESSEGGGDDGESTSGTSGADDTTSGSSSSSSTGSTGTGTTTGDGTTSTSTSDTTGTDTGSTTGTDTGTTTEDTDGDTDGDTDADTDPAEETSGSGEFALTSAEFTDGATIPDAHTCAAPEGLSAPSPSFSWSGAPDGTQSFALVMIDETLVGMGNSMGYHSALWNLPATVTSLPVGLGPEDLMGAMTVNNGYFGPCPGFSTGQGEEVEPHTYIFTLYALPEPTVAVQQPLDAAFIQTLETAALATATLSGTSTARPAGQGQ